MGTPAAPRIDDRLRRQIAGSPRQGTAAEVTRSVGELAWALGLPRPSYQQVRLLLRETRQELDTAAANRLLAREAVVRVIDTLYEYPGPGLAGFYERYRRGTL